MSDESAVDALASVIRAPAPHLQERVALWMDACFGPTISKDRIERNHRFLEEALELVQANGCTQSEAHQLVEYVYQRNEGDINQEVGGVMITLAALCLASGVDMHAAGETELARIWTKIDKIRAKQAAKPRHSPLPAPSAWRPTHRHYKGGLYEVLFDGMIEADLSPAVVYRGEDGAVWVRPKSDFDAIVSFDDQDAPVYRFRPIAAS